MILYRRFFVLIGSSLLAATGAFGQHLLSFGVKGGVPLTDAFNSETNNAVDVVTNIFSDSKNFIVGPTVEFNLPFGFSVEADALFRPLNLTTQTRVTPTSVVTQTSIDISSWEFPILGKYRFLHTPIIQPYVEAGPIFRAVGSRASYLSNDGFAFGAGVDVKVLILRIEPEIRFSRWGDDHIFNRVINAPSHLDQSELLLGITF